MLRRPNAMSGFCRDYYAWTVIVRGKGKKIAGTERKMRMQT